MGILQRFKDIMASNINALLDKAEDPEKMIDQTLRNLTKDLGEVKKETAAVMADEQRCKRELDEVNSEITKMQAYAEKALLAGNEADEDEIVNAIKNKYVSEGHRASAIKSLQIYLKPEENAAYYVINQKSMGMVPLF